MFLDMKNHQNDVNFECNSKMAIIEFLSLTLVRFWPQNTNKRKGPAAVPMLVCGWPNIHISVQVQVIVCLNLIMRSYQYWLGPLFIFFKFLSCQANVKKHVILSS